MLFSKKKKISKKFKIQTWDKDLVTKIIYFLLQFIYKI